jgi:hypothetical protein
MFALEKVAQKVYAPSVILKTTQRKQSPEMRKFAQSGHPGPMLQSCLNACQTFERDEASFSSLFRREGASLSRIL